MKCWVPSPCPLQYATSLFSTPEVEGVWGGMGHIQILPPASFQAKRRDSGSQQIAGGSKWSWDPTYNWGEAAFPPFLRLPRLEVTQAKCIPGGVASRGNQPKKLPLILPIMAQLQCLLSWKASPNLLTFSF